MSARGKASDECDKCGAKDSAQWSAHKRSCKIMAQAKSAHPDPKNPLPGDEMWDLLGADFDTEESRARLQREVPTGSEIGLKERPFTALREGTFFHNLSEIETYKLLIDCLRMHQEDVRDYTGSAMTNTIHDGKSALSTVAFVHFMVEAEQAKVLPPWWNALNNFECIRFAKSNNDFALTVARTGQRIQEAWGDPNMPVKLRMLAQKVYGWTVCLEETEGMLQQMAESEGKSALKSA
ncbi:hypothetical protein LTR95_013001 [Oleoguttula sp. CCFEE 5521]